MEETGEGSELVVVEWNWEGRVLCAGDEGWKETKLVGGGGGGGGGGD